MSLLCADLNGRDLPWNPTAPSLALLRMLDPLNPTKLVGLYWDPCSICPKSHGQTCPCLNLLEGKRGEEPSQTSERHGAIALPISASCIHAA